MRWVLDLDGVVWRGREAIAGSPDAIARLRELAIGVTYVTNNASLTANGYVDKLASFGIDAATSDVVHGGHAVASLVQPGERVLMSAGIGVAEAICDTAEVIDVADVSGQPPAVDVAVIGIRPGFRFEWLSTVVRSVLDGARLVAPSSDPLYPVPDGFDIGGGSMTHAIAYATGIEPEIAGKPFKPIVDVVASRAGAVDLVVGDQIRTDGRLAEQLGVPFALVRTGVTSSSAHRHHDTVPIAHDCDDLAAVVELLTGASVPKESSGRS